MERPKRPDVEGIYKLASPLLPTNGNDPYRYQPHFGATEVKELCQYILILEARLANLEKVKEMIIFQRDLIEEGGEGPYHETAQGEGFNLHLMATDDNLCDALAACEEPIIPKVLSDEQIAEGRECIKRLKEKFMPDIKPEYPLEVKVGQALDWTDFIQDKDEGFWWGTPPPNKTIPDPRPCPVPNYPTDVGEAIKALEKFCGKENLGFLIKHEVWSGPQEPYWVSINNKRVSFLVYEKSDKLAHAICLAICETAKKFDETWKEAWKE